MITTHGVPLSLYRDRHSIFQRNDSNWTLAEPLAGKQSPTQLGRALHELGIEQIPAYSPQAKGRIERIWRTCQDRLVSELRLVHASTLEQANPVLARFCLDHNQRFARAAAESVRDFRSLPRRFDLARCLSLRYQRVVSADHTRHPGRAPHLRCRPGLASADTLAKPSNCLINSMARCASFAETNFSAPCPCPSKNTPNAALLP